MMLDAADTFPKLLLAHSRQRGDRPAFREKVRGIWRTLSWKELGEEVQALAAALQARGLKRGAHLALAGDNRARLYATMCAAQLAGAVALPLYQDATAEEMAGPLRDSGATHAFAENQEQVDKLLRILPGCPALTTIVYDKDRGMRHYRLPQLVSYADLLAQGRELLGSRRDGLTAEAGRGAGSDAAFLFLTSGTTGSAKGVVLTHAALIDRARAACAAMELGETSVAMAYLPPGWIGQSLFAFVLPMVAGYCVCCPESSETMLADMRETGPTHFLATPRVLEALMRQVTLKIEDAGGLVQGLYRICMDAGRRSAARSLGGAGPVAADRAISALGNLLICGPLRDSLGMARLRAAYTAGDAIAPELVVFFRALGINLRQLYGSTETGFVVAVQSDGQVMLGSAGLPAQGVEVRLSSRREILVRSPGLFREYHGDAEATREARDGDGWYATGDAGHIDEHGHLRVIDRLGNVGTLADGTPFAPRAIESRIKCTAFVKEAVVFGEGRDKVCALIDIDPEAVGRWADRREISYTGHADLASRQEVFGLIADWIANVNGELGTDAATAGLRIGRFSILQKELSDDDGMLTRTGKLRRQNIAVRYLSLIEAMFDGSNRARVDAEEAGGTVSSEFGIGDVDAGAGMRTGRAA